MIWWGFSILFVGQILMFRSLGEIIQRLEVLRKCTDDRDD